MKISRRTISGGDDAVIGGGHGQILPGEIL
jgi:hypothetical protein